jgi:hypothetical protein
MGQSTALATQPCSVEGKKEGLYLREVFSRLILPEAHVRRVATKQLLSERTVPQLPPLLAVRPTMKASSDRLPAAPPVQAYLLPVCLPATAESWPYYLLAQFPAA